MIWKAERVIGSRTELSEAVARYLYKLLAYKDEYEVARLLTDPAFIAEAETQVPGGSRLTYRLHPPLLRKMGLRHKIGLGPWARPFLRALAQGKVLRGTWLDPFGHSSMRRLERQLAEDYRQRVRAFATDLRPEAYDTAVAIAELPDLVRGYEAVKLRNVRAYTGRLRQLETDVAKAMT